MTQTNGAHDTCACFTRSLWGSGTTACQGVDQSLLQSPVLCRSRADTQLGPNVWDRDCSRKANQPEKRKASTTHLSVKEYRSEGQNKSQERRLVCSYFIC